RSVDAGLADHRGEAVLDDLTQELAGEVRGALRDGLRRLDARGGVKTIEPVRRRQHRIEVDRVVLDDRAKSIEDATHVYPVNPASATRKDGKGAGQLVEPGARGAQRQRLIRDDLGGEAEAPRPALDLGSPDLLEDGHRWDVLGKDQRIL